MTEPASDPGNGPAVTFELISLFPEIFQSVLGTSLLGKAVERGLVGIHHTSPRDFGLGRHRSVDDTPYGGGSGMVMRPEPLAAALEHVESARGPAWKILLDPHGTPLDQAKVRELATRPRIALVSGRYEGFDERARALCDENLSLGDFVLSGGELAAMAIIDAVSRLHTGVLGNRESTVEESFESGLLEYPQYTRPPDFRGHGVPEILLSGDHEKIRRWRRQQSLLRTRARRPDLFARHVPSKEDLKLLREAGIALAPVPAAAPASTPALDIRPSPADRRDVAARTHVALLHHPVLDREGRVITTAITNLDLHDLARSTRTYGLAGLSVVTPVEAQRDLAASVLETWRRDGSPNADRTRAFEGAEVQPDLDAAIASVAARHGAPPILVGTSARPVSASSGERPRSVAPDALVAEASSAARPLLIVLGTGWGLANPVMDRVDLLLPAIQGSAPYNHLSVRSAAAVLLDRLFGDRR